VVVGSSPAAPATPPADRTKGSNGTVIAKIRRYIEESYSELKKVTWPTREQVRNLTVLVFAVSFVVGIFISAWDFIFTEALRALTTWIG
jgi:preprotein translocase subunit SecE